MSLIARIAAFFRKSPLDRELNAEMAAVWIAADLAGSLHLPDVSERREAVIEQLAFMDRAVEGHHCRGTKIIPFSMHNIDEVLGDLGVNIPAAVRASHWINPVDPAAYATIAPRVLAGLPTPGRRPSDVRGAAAVS